MNKTKLVMTHPGRHLSGPCQPFLGPLVAVLDFAGVEGGARVPTAPLPWYLILVNI